VPPQFPALLAYEAAAGTFIGTIIVGFQDIFVDLALGYNPFDFPTLMDEEGQLIEVMVEGRTCLEDAGLEVVRVLKRVHTIPSNIFEVYDKSFHRYLVLTSQIAFNIGMKPLVFHF
jgi:hypothetical protein